jgi:hypothetical protein
MTAQKCSEKACPYFAEPGQTLCRYHINYFEFDESLTDSGLDWEALHSGDEDGSSSSVGQLSVTNWRDDWLLDKERREDKVFIEKVAAAARYARLKESGLCPRCELPHDRETIHCQSCIQGIQTVLRELWRARRAQGLCEKCGGAREGTTIWCQHCRRRAYAVQKAIRESRLRKNQCVRCGSSQKERQKRYCSKCRSRQSKYFREWYLELRDARKIAGLCLSCGKKPAQDGALSCAECIYRRRAKLRRYREEKARIRPKRILSPKNVRGNYLSSTVSAKAHTQKLLAAGLCTNCARPNDCTSYLCTMCKTAAKARKAAKDLAWLEKGICWKCHTNPLSGGSRTCSECSLGFAKANAERREKLKKLRLCLACGHKRRKRGRNLCADCLAKRHQAHINPKPSLP